MEAETIRKKYGTILDMLKRERLTFGNQLEGLENQIGKQEDEIEKLKVILIKFGQFFNALSGNYSFVQQTHQSALATRDLARQNQHKKEIEVLAEGKERERRLIEYR